MVGYRVVTAALKEEADRWDALAADTRPVKAFIDQAELSMFAFFMVTPSVVGRLLSADTLASAPVHAAAYEEFRSAMAELADGAITEFGQISDALIKMRDKYNELEAITDISLADVYRAK